MKTKNKQKGYVFPLRRGTAQSTFGGAFRRLCHWLELARQRRQLASLSDEMLKDIGRSRADILRETERPFWDG